MNHVMLMRYWWLSAALVCCGSGVCSAQTVTDMILHDFTVQSLCTSITYMPQCSGLIQASDGNFYGIATDAGSLGYGYVYRITPAGTFTDLYDFTNKNDGSYPRGDLIEGADGYLYGGASGGGTANSGAIFKLTLAGKLSSVYSFCSQVSCPFGLNLQAGLILGSDGNFYGVTGSGGNLDDCFGIGCGFAFKLTPSGSLSVLHEFASSEAYGILSSLLEGSDGNFYGAAPDGGILSLCGDLDGGCGTNFKMTPSGELTVLHVFTDTGDDAEPLSGFVEGVDGDFYGTTQGDTTFGSVYKISSTGSLSLLHVFEYNGGQYVYGLFPRPALLLASDGAFYDTTEGGGSKPIGCPSNQECGTVFRITYAGDLSVIHDFCAEADCADGGQTSGALIQGSDGSIYGTTAGGGIMSDCAGDGCGTIYKLSYPGTLPPVQLSFSKSSVPAKSHVKLTWQVSNAFSLTMQQCYAYVQDDASDAGAWAGRQAGTLSSTTHLFSGSATIAPTAQGTYTYALTCGGTESGFATLTVTAPEANSSTSLSISPQSPSVGQSATLTAQVTGSGATPTGTVSFLYGKETLATKTLSSGSASYVATTDGLIPGTYPLTASYSGDSTYSPSISPVLDVALEVASTATSISTSPMSVTPPAVVTLTANVQRTANGAMGLPTGTVAFYSEGFELGSAKVNGSGEADLSLSSQGQLAGSYAVSAKYSGDSSDLSSTSSSVVVTIK